MIERHDHYDHTLQDYTKNQITYAFEDVFAELDTIQSRVQDDPQAVLLIHWVRYAVQHVLESFTE